MSLDPVRFNFPVRDAAGHFGYVNLVDAERRFEGSCSPWARLYLVTRGEKQSLVLMDERG